MEEKAASGSSFGTFIPTLRHDTVSVIHISVARTFQFRKQVSRYRNINDTMSLSYHLANGIWP